MVEMWIQKEIDKYKDKAVEYEGEIWKVKHVSWDDSTEEFVYWVENAKREPVKLWETEIQLI